MPRVLPLRENLGDTNYHFSWRGPTVGAASCVEDRFQVTDAVRIGVLRSNTSEGRRADRLGSLRRERPKVIGHLRPSPGNQHLTPGLEEELDARPVVGD